MLRIMTALLLFWTAAASAEIVNVEFEFTPFTGDVAEESVQAVPGVAHIFLNNVPIADQEIAAEEMPVMFDERKVSPSVWVPVGSLGPAVRKGKNTLRIEFEPEDAKLTYEARLHWSTVTDQTTQDETSSTNIGDSGVDVKKGPGPVTFEREFTADFVDDLPWHHYPPVKTLSPADRDALAGLLDARIELFKPDFSGIYAILEEDGQIKVDEVKKAKCLDALYDAGLRIGATKPGNIEMVTTGGPEVVVRAKDGMLFAPEDMSILEKITDEDTQMCAGLALFAVFPPRLVVVKSPQGTWEVAY